MILRLARQHRPQIINMFFERQTRVRDIFGCQVFRHPEVILNEALQIKVAMTSNLTVANQNIQRIHLRRAVRERFAVRKQACRLHVLKKFQITIGRGERIGCGQSLDHLWFRLRLDHLIQFQFAGIGLIAQLFCDFELDNVCSM
ncbi:hypothetical protein D3C80_1491210 [compost metagenome]